MIFVEQRLSPTINVFTRSGATTHIQPTKKQPDEDWVRKAPVKVPAFGIEKEQETVMGTKHDFVDPSTAVVPTQQHQ